MGLLDDILGKTLKRHANILLFPSLDNFFQHGQSCLVLSADQLPPLNVWSNSQINIVTSSINDWVYMNCILRHITLMMIALIFFESRSATTLLIFKIYCAFGRLARWPLTSYIRALRSWNFHFFTEDNENRDFIVLQNLTCNFLSHPTQQGSNLKFRTAETTIFRFQNSFV